MNAPLPTVAQLPPDQVDEKGQNNVPGPDTLQSLKLIETDWKAWIRSKVQYLVDNQYFIIIIITSFLLTN